MERRKGYRFMPHMADVMFVASGRTLNSAFKNAELALFDTIADMKSIEKNTGKVHSIKINLKARSLEDLAWKMLQYTLSESDSRSLFCYKVSDISVKRGNGFALHAEVLAKEKNVEASKLEVKGISKYMLKVSKTRHGFSISVVVDV